MTEVKNWPFTEIKRSVYLTDRPKRDEHFDCECEVPKGDPNATCCDSDSCLNRMMQIECSSNCRGKKRCQNQRFQRMQYSKTEVFDAGKKGKGLRAAEKIHV